MSTKKKPTAVPAGPFPFTYPEFEQWYSDTTRHLLEPGRVTVKRILTLLLDRELDELERSRVKLTDGRIKSPTRVWTKMIRSEYAGKIATVDDVGTQIDDLLGIRITCNNLSDVTRIGRILATLPSPTDDTYTSGLGVELSSERNYITKDAATEYESGPKESGYRAWHINLMTLVPTIDQWLPIRCELQVRTLLQDSWGELTHEDTYKPGSSLPPLITKIARNMADLLGTVDDLAETLRQELDNLAEEEVSDEVAEPRAMSSSQSNTEEDDPSPPPDSSSDDLRSALMSETQRVVRGLRKPATLASVAQLVQSSFGRSVVDRWGGFETFKALVQAAVPDAIVVDAPPGMVLPPGTVQSAMLSQSKDHDLYAAGNPDVFSRLRDHDRNFPNVPPSEMAELTKVVARVLVQQEWDKFGVSSSHINVGELNQFTKMARDEAGARRAHVDYVLKSLWFSGNLRPNVSESEILDIMESWVFSRASRLGLVFDSVQDRDAVGNWFNLVRNALS